MTVVFSAVEIGRELADLGISAFVPSFLCAEASCMLFFAKRPSATRKMAAMMYNGVHCTVSCGKATSLHGGAPDWVTMQHQQKAS